MIVGIDFGTCYSTVAIMTGMLPDATYVRDSTGMGMPTLFMYSRQSGKELFGEQCETAEAWAHSDDVIRHIKRKIRENPANLETTVSSGGRQFTYKHIIGEYLRFLIDEAKKGAEFSGNFIDTDIEEITITVPVGISVGQMMASEYNSFIKKTVMEVLNLPEENVHVLQEPVGAAISYLYNKGAQSDFDQPQNVLVVDLGGGTLDVTAVEFDPEDNTYRILAKEGDLNLGGNDWDAALAQEIMRRTSVREFNDPEEKAKFERAITKLKVDLSKMDEAGVFFKHNGKSKSASITRGEFESLSKELLDRLRFTLMKTLMEAGKAIAGSDETERGMMIGELLKRFKAEHPDADDRVIQTFIGSLCMDRVVLVGGGQNMPMISEAVNEIVVAGEKKVEIYDPSKAIAKGAAIYAKLMYDSEESYETPCVIDIVSHTYGILVTVDMDEQGKVPVIHNLIFRGEELLEGYILSPKFQGAAGDDASREVKIRVFESDLNREDCFYDMAPVHLCEANGLEVSVKIPRKYYGHATDYEIDVTMTLDVNGILTLKAYDAEGNELGCVSSQMKDIVW